MKTKVIVIVGPTASGKTSLSVKLALKYNGEIVSADSMQIYKKMQIATAKPTAREMHGVKHHLIDFLEPADSYSVGQYVIDAQNAVQDIAAKGKLPIICGGTGLYVDSLLNGIDFTENSTDYSLRRELEETAREKGVDYLLDMLAQFDPDSVQKLSSERNTKRIVRAIEFYKTTGIPISRQSIESRSKAPKYDSLMLGLTASDRQYLYNRADKRVDLMLQSGLLEEARSILSDNLSITSSKAIGYKQLLPYFKGEASIEECVERLKTETRHYIKRQLTWFRRNKSINWINIDQYTTADEQENYASRLIENRGFLNG